MDGWASTCIGKLIETFSTASPVMLSVISLEETLLGAMVQCLLEKSVSWVWYLWDRKDTHGKQTLAFENITSQHDQVKIMASDERDCMVLVDMGDWMIVGTVHYTVPTVSVDAWWLELCNVQFSMGQSLGDIVHCTVSVDRLGDYLLELHNA